MPIRGCLSQAKSPAVPHLEHPAAKVTRCRNEIHGDLVVLVELQAVPLALRGRHHLLSAPSTASENVVIAITLTGTLLYERLRSPNHCFQVTFHRSVLLKHHPLGARITTVRGFQIKKCAISARQQNIFRHPTSQKLRNRQQLLYDELRSKKDPLSYKKKHEPDSTLHRKPVEMLNIDDKHSQRAASFTTICKVSCAGIL